MDRSPETPQTRPQPEPATQAREGLPAALPAVRASPLCEALGQRQANCPEHGPYRESGARYFGRREIWTPCPACEEGQRAARRQAQTEHQARIERQALERAIGQAAIPARFVGRSLENFQTQTDAQRQALHAARDFVLNFDGYAESGQGLIFSGLPGTGKSHLATAILQALMPRHTGLYLTCMDLIRAVRGAWRKDSPRSESAVLETFAQVQLLALDEIGMQYGTEGEQTILFDVLDRRYRDLRPTILLTNQDSAGLRRFVGERGYDRLRETARFVAFDWPSHRPLARKEGA